MNPISFCNKHCLEVTSKQINKHVFNSIISNYDIDCNNKDHYIYLTRYNNKKYCLFINKDTKQLIYVRFRFKDYLFQNTLFDGKLFSKNNKWTFFINDILIHCGNTKFDDVDKTELIKNIMENDYKYDYMMNVCKIYFNRLTVSSNLNTNSNLNNVMKNNHIQYKNGDKLEFQMKKTDLPDVYELFHDGKNMGNPLINSLKTSKIINKLFKKDKSMITVKGIYKDNFKKWKLLV